MPRSTTEDMDSPDPSQPVLLLSKYAEEHGIEYKDVEKYVRRSTEERLEEKARAGKGAGRPSNAFMLYRVIFQHVVGIALRETKQNNTSVICGLSWRHEDPELKEKYKMLSLIERDGHSKAFGASKYCPKRKGPGPRGPRLATGGRKTGENNRKASRAPASHQRLHVVGRSPEPTYYKIEGTPSAEVPSLSSYQGTPLTSCIPTPQPANAQPYYTQTLETPFDQGICYSQLPYGRAQLAGPTFWNQAQIEQPMFCDGAAMYPELPDMSSAPQMGYYVDPRTYQQYPVQLAPGNGPVAVMNTMRQPQPVLRDIEPDADGAMDPRGLSAPMTDPFLHSEAMEAQADAVPQLLEETLEARDLFGHEQIVDDTFDYLHQYDAWTEDVL